MSLFESNPYSLKRTILLHHPFSVCFSQSLHDPSGDGIVGGAGVPRSERGEAFRIQGVGCRAWGFGVRASGLVEGGSGPLGSRIPGVGLKVQSQG